MLKLTLSMQTFWHMFIYVTLGADFSVNLIRTPYVFMCIIRSIGLATLPYSCRHMSLGTIACTPYTILMVCLFASPSSMPSSSIRWQMLSCLCLEAIHITRALVTVTIAISFGVKLKKFHPACVICVQPKNYHCVQKPTLKLVVE